MFALAFAMSASAQFAPGCGPFFGGNPNVANFNSGNQLAANIAIPTDMINFGLATQQSGCTPYTTIRGVVGQSATLPPGVTATLSTTSIQSIKVNGTPTATGTYGPYAFEVSPDGGTTWAVAMNVTFNVASCVDWNGSRNQRLPLPYPAPNNYLSIAQPTSGVAYSFEGSLQSNSYVINAYCTATSWTLNNFGGGTMSVASDPSPTLRKFLISGTPATTAQPQADGCLTPDTGPDATITGFNSAGEDIVTLNFCFNESNSGVLTIGGNPPPGVVGSLYATALTSSIAPTPQVVVVFTLIGGALPPGLVLASDGSISGTPTQAGVFAFTAQVTASNLIDVLTASAPFSITVNALPAAIANVVIPTLDSPGLALLAILLAGAGAFSRRRRR